MPFTVTNFVDDAEASKGKQTCTAPTPSPTPSPPRETSPAADEHPACRKACSNLKCQQYEPKPRQRRTLSLVLKNKANPLTPLKHSSATRIYVLHEKLADLQESINANNCMINLIRAGVYRRSSRNTQHYLTLSMSSLSHFEVLIGEIRSSAAYFGYVDMPPRTEFIDQAKAVLFNEEIASSTVRSWISRTDVLRSKYANESEKKFEKGTQYKIEPVGFTEGWSFEAANQGGGHGLEADNRNPDAEEAKHSNYGAKFAGQQNTFF